MSLKRTTNLHARASLLGVFLVLTQVLSGFTFAEPVSLTTSRNTLTRTTTVVVRGLTGTAGALEASEDMVRWSQLQPFVLGSTPLSIVDPWSLFSARRFYRVSSSGGAQLVDLSEPANAVFPAGEGVDTIQYSPEGTLGYVAWRNLNLVLQERGSAGSWSESTITSGGKPFNSAAERQFSSFQPAAFLAYDKNSTPHVFVLRGGSDIAHFARGNNGSWTQRETLNAPGTVTQMVGAVGPGDIFHVGVVANGTLLHAATANGSWRWSAVDTAAPDAYWTPGSFSRRWLSLAVDLQNVAHFVYRPSFDFTRHPEGYMRAYTKLKYASNPHGSWFSEIVREPDDISGEAGSGQSIAIGPDGNPAIASWYNERGDGGSSQWSRLQYYTRTSSGQWQKSEVLSRPERYIAGDGEKGTGAYPYLRFDARGRPHILFTDHASEHFPYQNEYAGHLRHAVWNGNEWKVETLIPQDKPLQEQILFPAFAMNSSEIAVVTLERLTSWNTGVNPQVAVSTYRFRMITKPLL